MPFQAQNTAAQKLHPIQLWALQLIFNKNIIDGSKIRFSVQYTWQIFGLQGFRLVNRLRSYSQDAIPVNQNFVMSTEQRNLL